MSTSHSFAPHAVVEKLKTEAVALNLVHIHAEYDDYYTIWYVPRDTHFKVNLEVSVWDGRGHESYKEKLDEATLLERLVAIQATGRVVSFYYESRK